MIRFLLIGLIFSSLFSANVSDKIKDQKNSIDSAKKLESQINKKLEELANDIIAGNKAVQNTAKQIEELAKQVEELEDSFGINFDFGKIKRCKRITLHYASITKSK